MWVVSGCDSASPITTFKTTEIACTSGLESTAKTTACTSDGVTNGVMSLGFVCKNQTTKDLNTITRTTCTDLESLKSQAEIVCKQKYPCTGETACVDSTWTPDKSTVCSGKTYLQKSNCGIEKEATGTKTDGACLTCNNETWSPAVDTICKGVEFTQKSSCDASKTRTSTGTKTDGSCSTNTTNGAVDLTIEKRAYEDVSNNSAGDYDMSYEIDKVAKDQVFVYAFEITNDGDATASAIKVVDVLKGDNRELLSFVDGDGDCGYVNSTRTVTCQGMSLKPGESKVYAFRVKVANSAINGDTISNTGTITYKDMPSGGETESNNELTISTVVGCNHVCTSDDECSTGLICDTDTSKCRKAACTEATACNCTVQKTSTETTPTKKITMAATKPQPTELPETGILDFPGVATFGGGLLLAVIGILLAL